MKLGENIKLNREKHNMTQAQLSQQLFLSRGAVNNYEKNRHVPALEILILMADMFKITLDELVRG